MLFDIVTLSEICYNRKSLHYPALRFSRSRGRQVKIQGMVFAMNNSKTTLTTIYCAAIAAVLVLFLVVSGNLGTPAKSLTGLDDPQETVSEFFGSLRRGDLEAAGSLLSHCNLENTDMTNQSDVNRKLYQALCDSISVRFAGDSTVDGLDAVQTVQVTYFDISSSASKLNELTKQQIDIMLNDTASAAELYNENSEYRPEVVMQIFDQAAMQLLENPSEYYVTRTFDIELLHEGDGWFIVPSDDLMDCILGGMN